MSILRLLLSHNPKIDSHDGYGATALHMAVKTSKPEIVKALLEFGAALNTRCDRYIDGPTDYTPLHDACNSQEIFDLLLDFGADITAKDSRNQTPIDWAERSGKFRVEVNPSTIITYSHRVGPSWSNIEGRGNIHARF